MVNCNPETVSTDPTLPDRLYFEPLTGEDVIEIVQREQAKGELLGVIVQLGGQTPLRLAAELQAAGVTILGTSPDSSIWPKIASALPSWSSAWGCCSRPTASRGAATRRSRWPSGSAIRCCCGRPTCSAGAAWRWSTGRSSSIIISPPRWRCRGPARSGHRLRLPAAHRRRSPTSCASSSRCTPRRSTTPRPITFFLTGAELPGRPSMGAWLTYGLGSENAEPARVRRHDLARQGGVVRPDLLRLLLGQRLPAVAVSRA